MKGRFLVSLVAVSILLAMPTPAAADLTSICPDNMVLVPASSVVSGSAKDKNANGLVCAKYTDGGFKGGPDDSLTDDIII